MAKDLFHDVVKNGLIKEGWHITDDPYFVKTGGVEFFIDLGAERMIAAEKEGERIAVEIKSFIGPSAINDLHLAVGQFINYRVALSIKDSARKLFLAVPETTYETLFQKELIQRIVLENNLKLIVYNIDQEEIVLWQT
ncbi:MAG: fatty-acid oxidation protein subunit alpha [Spirulina sp. SIO3F2]|nr:fatty-acid oxidation protein subunit alpha [Spirulina sp. SIO3F2]